MDFNIVFGQPLYLAEGRKFKLPLVRKEESTTLRDCFIIFLSNEGEVEKQPKATFSYFKSAHVGNS